LLQACRQSGNKHLYGLVVAALYTGLRQGSLLSLTKKDIDSTARTLTIEKTKNKTRLVLPLLGEAYALMTARMAHITENEYIFPNTGNHNRWESYRHAFNYAVKRANIPAFTFHCLRHSTASYLVQAGIPLYVVSQILSHKSIATTQRYAHLATENLKDALETLSQRLSS
jgi:integrase